MNILDSLQMESVQLQNRIGRLILVNIQCITHAGRYCVIVQSTADIASRQLTKSAEQLAHQIVKRLSLEPELVDFIQCQPGEDPEWLRWRFQWVGQSPLQGKHHGVDKGFEDRVLKPMLSEGNIVSFIGDNIPFVA